MKARFRVNALGLSVDQLQIAVAKVPLPLSEAAIFLRADAWGVGYEAAAIFALKESAHAPKKVQLRVHEIVKGFEESPRLHTGGRWGERAGACFANLVERFRLRPSRWSSEEMLECLSVAFLHSHRERLVWSIKQDAGRIFLHVFWITSITWPKLIQKFC